MKHSGSADRKGGRADLLSQVVPGLAAMSPGNRASLIVTLRSYRLRGRDNEAVDARELADCQSRTQASDAADD